MCRAVDAQYSGLPLNPAIRPGLPKCRTCGTGAARKDLRSRIQAVMRVYHEVRSAATRVAPLLSEKRDAQVPIRASEVLHKAALTRSETGLQLCR